MSKYYDEKEPVWDGDSSKIPDVGTLIAYDTASSGLINGVVCGYNLTYQLEKHPHIRIHIANPGSLKKINERFIEEIQIPLNKREKTTPAA